MMTGICVFRVDVSVRIATGHLMRCLVLARALHQQGYQIHFICREHLPLEPFFNLMPFFLHKLAKSTSNIITKTYQDWLEVSVNQDIQDTLDVMPDCDWLIIDHYALDEKWVSKVKHRCKNVMIIDDLANRSHEGDLLLDQNFYLQRLTRYSGLLSKSCRQLLGLDYVLLPESIKKAIPQAYIRHELKKILVHFGGVDANGETVKALMGIQETGLPLDVDVLVGNASPHKQILYALCKKNSRWRYHCQIDYIDKLILEADLALGAGGVALWERMALGLPTVASCIADNQRVILEDLSQKDYIVYLGHAKSTLPEDYSRMIHYFNSHSTEQKRLSNQGIQLIDGHGVGRVLQAMKDIGGAKR